MRSEGHSDFNTWILKVGSGNLDKVPGVKEDVIEIPEQMIETGNMIDKIFPNLIK
ncbi:hypothetical protein BB559_006714, partial [Furculomyces boomerangus]